MATFKANIAPVPTAADFLDIVLSKTQRKTPTVVHPGWKITRIRSFYSRKVMFTKDAFTEKLDAILAEFPILDNLHPFSSSLMNVLYDKNHYKLALGQLSTARHLIESIAKDYVRLIKYGDSLYRCKQLKRAALGRMATVMRRQKDPLAYLEQVRQHMSRLPSIDPSTRTLLVCGYPNVGKSSFLNRVTRADVDVQPYAFTTKSLFVGHMDYQYLRWQVVDTPGILDHPLEEMNTIEMQSITALAHLRSAVLYFMDVSEQCGYTVEAQVQLFESIRPLFANKPTLLVLNKSDARRLDELDDGRAALVRALVDEEGAKKEDDDDAAQPAAAAKGKVHLVEISTQTDEGVMECRNLACDLLLASRLEQKRAGAKAQTILNRLHVSVPRRRDDVERAPFVPRCIVEGTRVKWDADDPARRRLERDEQEEKGGAGVYSIDMKKRYMLADEAWKQDVIPEIVDGKNVADFVDADIMDKLEALELEEERLEAEGFYDESSDEEDDEGVHEVRRAAEAIRERQLRAKLASQDRKSLKARARLPRNKLQNRRTLEELERKLREIGVDPSSVTARAEMLAKARKVQQTAAAAGKRKRGEGEGEGMELDDGGRAAEKEEAWTDDEAASGEEMDVDGGVGGGSRKLRKVLAGPVGLRALASGVGETAKSGARVTARAGAVRRPSRDRRTAGLGASESRRTKATELQDLSLRERNRLAKASESDRKNQEMLPKWLYSGKRKNGTHRSR